MTPKIAKITPLLRLPSSVDVFDYFISPDLADEVRVGQTVSVPWRNRYIQGVILSLASKEPVANGKTFRARPIKKIIDPRPVLTQSQLALIKKFSEYYFVTPGSVARLIAPMRPARNVTLDRNDRIHRNLRQNISFQIAKSQLPRLAQTAAALKNKTNFLEIQDISSFVWLVFYLLKKQSSPLLLLLPTINLIDMFSTALSKHQAQTAVIHSGLSLGAYWQAYQAVLNKKTKIILSTRQGAFLPLPQNSTIIMFDAGSADFKQYDQHPRYDARLVAGWTAALTKSQLLFAAPDFFLRPDNRAIALPPAAPQPTAIQLVDMKQNLQSPEFSIVSDQVIDAIRQAQTARKKIVIIALREQVDKGVSVNKINDILTGMIKNGNDDIIVSTPALLESGQLLPMRGQIACLVIASIEPLLALLDFRAGERAYYRLKHWQSWAQELAIPKIILQSYSPDNPAVRAFAYNEVDAFVAAELGTRKRFDYPPFSQLIKLTYQGKDESEITRVVALLKSHADDKLTVRGPYQSHKSEKKSILLKIAFRHPEPHIKYGAGLVSGSELVSASDSTDLSFLRTLSLDWAIDRDPENVL